MKRDDVTTRRMNEQTLRRAMSAITAQDLDAVRAELHEDVVFDLPFQAGVSTYDREGYGQLLSTMFVMFERLEIAITVVYDLVDPDMLIAQWKSSGLGRGRPVSYRNDYLGVFRFCAGKIASWRGYANPEAANAALAKLVGG